MPIDSNIALQGKAPDIANPLDIATKALTMSNLMQEHQGNALKLNEQQRQFSDAQTVRDAYKNNTQVGPDGMPIVDRQGLMGDLMKANPQLAQKQAMDFKTMDLDKLNQQHAAAKSILFGPMNTQSDLDNAVAQAHKLGLPPLEGVLPKDINDPNFQSALRKVQVQNLTAEEQLAQQNKQTEFQMQAQKNDLEGKKLGVEMAHFDYQKKFDANQQVQNSIEGSRQADDAKQALKDVQAANKVNGLLEQAKDPKGNLDYNKLDNQQVRLLYGEVGKIAQGGAPTEGGLHEMTPETAKAMLANFQSLSTNKPVPAEMGAFIQKIKAYTDELGTQGKDLLRSRENRIVDQRKDDLGDKNYQNYKAGIKQTYGEKAAPPPSNDVVDVKLPDGRTGTIPRANLQKAIASGASLMNKTVVGN